MISQQLLSQTKEVTMSTATLEANATRTAVFQIDGTHSEVRFRVRHLLSRVGGQFRTFDGTIAFDPAQPERARVNVTIDAASIDTGVADRDAHLRSDDFFAVDTHPRMTFVSDQVTKTGDGSFAVAGTLTIRGVSRRIELPVSYLGLARDPYGRDLAAFESTVRLNRKDFGLTWNAALETGGVLVGDEVEIALNIEAVRS
jgi:polyisoprenoid-binding protein YceI